MPNSSRPFTIVSMDGGGVAGLVTNRLLQRIGANMPDYLDDVGMLAGTSAGAINALIMAQHDNPKEGLQQCINLWNEPLLMSNTPLGSVRALVGVGPFISPTNFRATLMKYLPA
ncbi:MAG: patatin-like phospholipase family protein, partial [bacterium]|nr:patatin-like phospholipase family protein [bacterium]